VYASATEPDTNMKLPDPRLQPRCTPPLRQPVKRELQLIYVVDEHKPEFIFVIGQSGFKSVASLEEYIQTWPPGSELKWAPGCERFGGEPLLSSEDEMRTFRAFLAERHIKFILIPSG
jgi:hypothetical protein